MFDKQIRLVGRHAEIIKKYSQNTSDPVDFLVNDTNGNQVNVYIFDTLLNAYMTCAMIGIIEKKSIPSDSTQSTDVTATIFADILHNYKNTLDRIYQHMVLMEADAANIDSAIKRAFSIEKSDDIEEEKIKSYARGGLEIIDGLFSSCETIEDISNAIIDLSNKYSLAFNISE